MQIIPKIAALIFILCSTTISLGAVEETEIIYAFRSFVRPKSEKMILVGEIRSKIKAPEPPDLTSPYQGYDTRKDQVTVKVINRKGLKVGQKLYVIDKNPFHKEYRNGIVVGEITVRAIFEHPFFGNVLTGTGILLRVREGMFIARTLDTEKLAKAFEKKKQGDHYYYQGDTKNAMANYLSALDADSKLPEAHSSLGQIFLEEAKLSGLEIPFRALSEFKLAWENRANFHYQHDEYKFYLSYMEALFLSYQLGKNEVKTSSEKGARELANYLENILTIGESAKELKPPDMLPELHICRASYYLMHYYNRRDEQRSEKEKTRTAELLKKLLEAGGSRPELYLTAFLFYNDIFRDIVSDPKLMNYKMDRLSGIFYYGDDFYRWEDVRYPSRETGVERVTRMLIYLGEKYDLFLDPATGKRDPDFVERFRAL